MSSSTTISTTKNKLRVCTLSTQGMELGEREGGDESPQCSPHTTAHESCRTRLVERWTRVMGRPAFWQAVTNATNASPASSVSEFSSSFNLGNSLSSTSDSPSSTVVVANERAPRQAHRPRKRFCIAERPQKLAPPCAVGLVAPLCRYGGSLVLEIKILHR